MNNRYPRDRRVVFLQNNQPAWQWSSKLRAKCRWVARRREPLGVGCAGLRTLSYKKAVAESFSVHSAARSRKRIVCPSPSL